MIINKFHKISFYKISIAFLFSIAILINIYSAKLDPDPHHDGFIISTAIASNSGLKPYRDTFTYFGPVVHWLNSTVLWVINRPGYELLTLRVTYFLVSLLTVLILFRVIRETSYDKLARLSLIAWLLSHPVWSGQISGHFNFWPWPDQLNYLFLSVALWSLVRVRNVLGALITGLALALGIYVKVNAGILATLILLSFMTLLRKNQETGYLKWTLISFVASNTSILSILKFNNQLTFFVQDTIIYPRETFGMRIGSSITNLYFMGFNNLTLILLAVFILHFLFRNRLATAFGARLLGTLIVCLVLVSLEISQNLAPDFFSSRLVYLHLGVGIVLLSLSFLLKKGNWLKIRMEDKFKDCAVYTCALISIASALYIGDVYHLWAAAPCILIASAMILKRFGIDKIQHVLLIVCILLNLHSAKEYVTKPREQLKVSPLMGMRSAIGQNEGYESVARMFEQMGDQRTNFLCQDGLFHVLGGDYRPSNTNPFGFGSAGSSWTSSTLVVCIQNEEWIDSNIRERYIQIDKVVFNSPWSHWSTSKILWFERK